MSSRPLVSRQLLWATQRFALVLIGYRMKPIVTREDTVGFVFEDVSTAWEIDLWPKWDDSPWIDGGQRIDIRAARRTSARSRPARRSPLHRLFTGYVWGDGIPSVGGSHLREAASELAQLGDNLIQLRAAGTRHFIHEHPSVMVTAVEAVVTAAGGDEPLQRCPAVFEEALGTCLF